MTDHLTIFLDISHYLRTHRSKVLQIFMCKIAFWKEFLKFESYLLYKKIKRPVILLYCNLLSMIRNI